VGNAQRRCTPGLGMARKLIGTTWLVLVLHLRGNDRRELAIVLTIEKHARTSPREKSMWIPCIVYP